MRKTRAILTALVAVTVLALGQSPVPAEATAERPPPSEAPVTVQSAPPGFFYLAPYTNLDFTFGTCFARFSYGNYGNVAYANMTALNGGCSTLSQVGVTAWGDTSYFCNYLTDTNLHPDCYHSGSVLQAVAVGPLVWGDWRVHTGAASIDLKLWPFP